MLAMGLLLTWPVQAADGVLIAEKTTTGTDTHTNQVQIEKTRMRAASAGPTGEEMTMIFDGTKQVLWMVNDAKKTYNEMTKADVSFLGVVDHPQHLFRAVENHGHLFAG